MRKTVLAALVFSMFGTGAALANCESAWISWAKCESYYGKGAVRRGTSGWFFKCSPCINSYCNNDIYRKVDENDHEYLVKQKAREMVDEFGPLALNVRGGDVKKIAMEIARRNPLAGAFFIDFYMVSNKIGVSIPEEGVLGSGDEIVKSEHDFESAIKFIENYAEKWTEGRKGCASEGIIKFRYDYNIKRFADDSAYLRIRVSEVNGMEEEVRMINPLINVKLRAAEDGGGVYWEPVGWGIG